jgi:hypothetical protein
VLALAAGLLCAGARGQACCAGASLLSPGRLTPHEDGLVGLEVRAGLQSGSLDVDGRFHANAAGSGEVQLAQSLVGSLRVLRDGQLSLEVPLVESGRWVPGLTEWGAGLGDVLVSFRYDFVLAGESLRLPGLALLAGVTFPTGRSPEQARQPLGSDSTGTGLWQAAVGLGLEQTVGHVFLQGSALVQQGLPRTALGVTELLGPSFSLGLAAGWAFDWEGAVALTATSVAALPAWVNGVVAPGTARWRSAVGLSGAFPLSDAWRLQVSLATHLPVGLSEPLSTTLTLLLMRTFS